MLSAGSLSILALGNPEETGLRTVQPMNHSEVQTYYHARRETALILAVWLVAMVYIVTYCYLFGGAPQEGQLNLVWGMPSWVFWGVVVPWLACDVTTVWFCLWYMADDDLGPDRAAEVGDGD